MQEETHSPENDDKLRMAIYEQDCQSLRHQDTLTWSRFQTAATIEAGMLFGLYNQTWLSITPVERIALAFVASLLVLIVSSLVSVAKGKIVRQNRYFQRFSATSFTCQGGVGCLSFER